MVNHIQDKISAMFSDLHFDSQRHLYFVDGVKYPSVTGLISKNHVEPFDSNKLLKSGLTLIQSCAKKEGVSEHELMHKWQTINKDACDLGTETHDFLEKYTGIETPTTPQQRAGLLFFKDITKEYEVVFRELRMYSRKYKFAGTADLLLKHKTTGALVLADYKTNKDIFKTFGYLKKPFDYLQQHPYNEYQLQLSYYQLFLEEIGCCISDRLLVYLKADETYKIFSLFDFTTHLVAYLDNIKIAA